MVLEKIDYKKIFYYFEEISQVPRGSKDNQGISNYLVAFAQKHQLKYQQDEYLNVIIWKDASCGYENAPTVMLQGHMDMVCEKEIGCTHDFQKQGLDLDIDGDFIYAKGTTLGADDGIALAFSLAILVDNSLMHPALEVLFTTDEETGMDGALGLNASILKAKYMLNIDSEEEGILLSSCAGGMTATCDFPTSSSEESSFSLKKGTLATLQISGLQGGHSGTEINKNRTNAVLLLGRVINSLMDREVPFYINKMQGGLKDNVIPREAFAEMVVEDFSLLKEKVEQIYAEIKKELQTSEATITISLVEKEEGKYKVFTEDFAKKIVFMLTYTPNGVQKMSADIENLVESSLNLGIFSATEKEVLFSYSIRSSLSSYKRYLAEKLKGLTEHLGGNFSIKSEYPAWEYKQDSKLREILCHAFEQQYEYSPKIEAIHAGLECGILAEKMPGIDIVSFGPDIFDIHTPKERMSISSCIRVYNYIVKSLEMIH